MGSTIRDTQSDQTYDQPYDWPHDDWLPDHDFDRLPLSKICNNFFFPFEHRMRGRCRRWEHMRVPSHRRAQPQLKIRWNTHCAGWFWQTGVSQNLQSTATATAVMRRPITAKNSAPSALDFMLFHWTASLINDCQSLQTKDLSSRGGVVELLDTRWGSSYFSLPQPRTGGSGDDHHDHIDLTFWHSISDLRNSKS